MLLSRLISGLLLLAQNSFDLIEKPTGAVPETVEIAIDGSSIKTTVSETIRANRQNSAYRCRYSCFRRKRNEIAR